MTASALSVFIFGIYLAVLGASIYMIPNALLPIFGFQKSEEVWTHVLGVVVGFLGFYYIEAARHNLIPFFWATVFGRFGLFFCFLILVLLRKTKPMLLLFGAVDAVTAIWTLFTLI